MSVPSATRSLASSALLFATSLGVVACGDDSPTGSGTATADPEDLRAPAAQVAEGLTEIHDLATSAAADPATDVDEEITRIWRAVEGSVKANDPEAYNTFEASFDTLSDAVDDDDAGAARGAAATIARTVERYLFTFPW